MPQKQPDPPLPLSPTAGRLPFPVSYMVLLLDPRRWVGAVLAIGGVIISVVTPLLPSAVVGRLLHADQTMASPRHRRRLSAPGRRKRARHEQRRLSESHHEHLTMSPDELSTTTGSSANSSFDHPPTAQPIQMNTNEFPHTRRGPPLNIEISAEQLPCSPCSPRSASPELLPSIECLDLASPQSRRRRGSNATAASTNSRLQFRVKIGFGKKRVSSSDGRGGSAGGSGSGGADEEYQHVETLMIDPMGNYDPQVSRVHTAPPTSSRKKFSIFHRNSFGQPSRSLTVSDAEDSRTSLPRHRASTAHALHFPHFPHLPRHLPEASSLFHRTGTNVNTNITPSTSLNDESVPQDSNPTRTGGRSGGICRRPSTPPSRPRRTDPYKKYGVPMPGSEEAKAFARAERERREKLWRARESEAQRNRLAKEREREDAQVRTPTSAQAQADSTVTTAGKPSQGRQEEKHGVHKPWRRLSRGKDKEKEKEREASDSPAHTPASRTSFDHPDPGIDADAEDDPHSRQSHESAHSTTASAVPPPPSSLSFSSSPLKKSWVFARRSSTAEERARRSQLPPPPSGRCACVSDREDATNANAEAEAAAKESKKKLRFMSGHKKRRAASTDHGYSSEVGLAGTGGVS